MSHIAEYLKTFSQNALQKLEDDARGGLMLYWSPYLCFLGHHQDGYPRGGRSELQANAEIEYHGMGYESCVAYGSYLWRHRSGDDGSDEIHEKLCDDKRQRLLLPLIEREKERRRLEKEAVPFYQPAPAVPQYEEVRK